MQERHGERKGDGTAVALVAEEERTRVRTGRAGAA